MIKFAQLFSEIEIVSTLSAKLSWSHFVKVLILENHEKQIFIYLVRWKKTGIIVAEYWTDLPPKNKLEDKLHSILKRVKARPEQRNLLD